MPNDPIFGRTTFEPKHAPGCTDNDCDCSCMTTPADPRPLGRDRAPGAETPETVDAGLARRRAAVSHAVERLMDARRMSYGDLSRATGLSRTGLFKIVDGTSDPTLSSLLRIADFFGLTLNDLLAEASHGD